MPHRLPQDAALAGRATVLRRLAHNIELLIATTLQNAPKPLRQTTDVICRRPPRTPGRYQSIHGIKTRTAERELHPRLRFHSDPTFDRPVVRITMATWRWLQFSEIERSIGGRRTCTPCQYGRINHHLLSTHPRRPTPFLVLRTTIAFPVLPRWATQPSLSTFLANSSLGFSQVQNWRPSYRS